MITIYNTQTKDSFNWFEIIFQNIKDCPNYSIELEKTIKSALNNLEKDFTESNFREVIALLNCLKNTNVAIQDMIVIPRTIYVEYDNGYKSLFQI